MKKYNILISYVVEAEHEVGAAFALHRSLYPLGEDIDKFNTFHIEEVQE
jgi:hypothetical protein